MCNCSLGFLRAEQPSKGPLTVYKEGTFHLESVEASPSCCLVKPGYRFFCGLSSKDVKAALL